MNIKYNDIDTISHALCYANAMLQVRIEELKEKGFLDIAAGYESEREKTIKAIDSLQKIRKELHLSDDYAYAEKFKSDKY